MEKRREKHTLVFRVVSLGDKAEKGVLGITSRDYSLAGKNALRWRKDSRSPSGAIRRNHSSQVGTYVDFYSQGNYKKIEITSTSEGLARSVAKELGLKRVY